MLIAAAGAWIFQKLSSLALWGGQSCPQPPSRRQNSVSAIGKKRPAPLGALLIFAWWLVLPVLLFGLLGDHLSESVYLARYLSLALPGTALAATWAAARLLPPGRWNAAAALMGCGALGHAWTFGRHFGRRTKNPAGAAPRLRSTASRRPGTLAGPFKTSPFIEGYDWPDWRPDYPPPRLPLTPNWLIIRFHATVILFPFEDANYLRRSADSMSPSRSRWRHLMLPSC